MIACVQERFKVQGFVLTGRGGARHPGDRRRVRRESGGHRELDGTRVLRESAKHWPSIKQKQSAPKTRLFFGGEPWRAQTWFRICAEAASILRAEASSNDVEDAGGALENRPLSAETPAEAGRLKGDEGSVPIPFLAQQLRTKICTFRCPEDACIV